MRRMEKKRVRGASTSTSSSSASSARLPLLLLLLLSPLLNIASWHHTASVSIFPYCLNQLLSTLSLTRLSHSQFQNPKESPPPYHGWLRQASPLRPNSMVRLPVISEDKGKTITGRKEDLSSTTQQSARNSCADTGLDVVLHCRRDGGTVVY
ncbi:hypothetical protein BO85DRAFT_290835 [Aspergillus piperis CBS 112811]|uniref:Ig-like domain-containing protein n=1 Tax=Aspergillus piperis CBS 112811 TaxID=1448313 RepID=A0A8G1VLV4_9EURO|nr:hypothetical protein BO85DRAFT_290835 [Aspergillus piperis CBS 112811]RAH57981.1 hypothetical protein BO85DRAFT_290835 [Aspergillus piperis CBS 112811]